MAYIWYIHIFVYVPHLKGEHTHTHKRTVFSFIFCTRGRMMMFSHFFYIANDDDDD